MLEADQAEHAIAEGDGLEIEAGVPHQVFNRSDQDTWFLVVSQAPSHGDRTTA